MGGISCRMMNPAKILPIASRLMEFVSIGLFSFMVGVSGKRWLPSRARKII